MVREALKMGLGERHRLGVNPFKYGIIASTDSHLGTPGLVAEDDAKRVQLVKGWIESGQMRERVIDWPGVVHDLDHRSGDQAARGDSRVPARRGNGSLIVVVQLC
jgi:Protein of unknown function (DUF3604)